MRKQKDIRWLQRFSNFNKALNLLEKFIEKGALNELEEQGCIKAFEYTYELGWNTLKDYLEYQGYTDIKGSRDTIREAYRVGLITDGEEWMQMYESRIKTSHTYNEDTAKEVTESIHESYYPLFVELKKKLEQEGNSSEPCLFNNTEK